MGGHGLLGELLQTGINGGENFEAAEMNKFLAVFFFKLGNHVLNEVLIGIGLNPARRQLQIGFQSFFHLDGSL